MLVVQLQQLEQVLFEVRTCIVSTTLYVSKSAVHISSSALRLALADECSESIEDLCSQLVTPQVGVDHTCSSSSSINSSSSRDSTGSQ
jgi:hypothetical protein